MNGIGFDSLVWAQSCSINISKKQKKNSAIAIHLYLVVLLRSPTWWIQLSYPRTRSFSCKILTSILTPQIAIPLTTPALVVWTLAAFTYRICLYLPWHTWTLHTDPLREWQLEYDKLCPKILKKPITTWCGLVFPRFLLLFFFVATPDTSFFYFNVSHHVFCGTGGWHATLFRHAWSGQRTPSLRGQTGADELPEGKDGRMRCFQEISGKKWTSKIELKSES